MPRTTSAPALPTSLAPSASRGKAVGLVLPRCDTAATNLHLAEIAEVVAPDAHAIVLLDQAGWHKAKDLNIPANISLLPLPPRSPEPTPVENVWRYMRENWLTNRVFTYYKNILRAFVKKLRAIT